ncbi:MAG: hypothetical protein A2133_09055 [Actinobacteria bacterium RBG_16_64_13]|nr:MAG: hypothetical protein A2133_09055 [Actinobacteria bacterium RBG_16_64_13]
MSRLTRQRIGILVLAILTSLLLAGCFGGGGGDTETTRRTDTTAGPGGGSGNGSGNGTGELSDVELLDVIDGLPEDFVQAYSSRPIVVLFYIPGNADDTSVVDTVNRLKSSFDRYAFLLYDYKDPNAYGTLSQLLKVSYPPYIVLIDGAGYPQRVFTGYVDEGTLNQSLVNLGRE